MGDLSLFELSGEYREAMENMADLELDDQTIADTLEGLRGDLELKAQNIAKFVRNLEANAEAIKEAERQMAARRKALENRAARIKAYILDNMQRASITRIDSPWFTLAVRKNPLKVIIDDVDELPPEYMMTPEPPPPEPNKKGIATALKEGQEVPGAHLEQGERLDIR